MASSWGGSWGASWGNSWGVRTPDTPSVIYQQIWIIEERKKGEPRKARRQKKKLKVQLAETIGTVSRLKELQAKSAALESQKRALDLAAESIRISQELLEIQIATQQLEDAAQSLQTQLRFEKYIRQEYEKALRIYQEEQRRKAEEHKKDLEALLLVMMHDD